MTPLCYALSMTSTLSTFEAQQQSHLAETAAWYWLAHESGLGLRRVKEIMSDHGQTHSQSLHEILISTPLAREELLKLTVEESQLLEKQLPELEITERTLAGWQHHGMGMVRLNESSYPPTLRIHLRAVERPLLLNYQGELGLLDMPTVMAFSGADPDEEAIAWTIDTMLELAHEGALPLLVAKSGLDARLMRSLLESEAPCTLVFSQGLASYAPPPSLNSAISAGRTLLISPFRPDWTPPPDKPNPMLPHALGFAQALANALLIVNPPHPLNLLPEQPCFLRPDIPKTIGCQSYYADPEELFLRLVEIPTAASTANLASQQPPLPQDTSPPETPIDTEKLITRLSEMGNVPEAMKARLRTPKPNN